MKALVYTAPGSVELQDLPEPHPSRGDVLVRVSHSGICGSDVHGYQGKSRIRIPPAVMGHEFTGVVEAVGEEVVDVQTGQRVVIQPIVGCGRCRWCRAGRPNICPSRQLIGAHRHGGFAELVSVPVQAVYPIPESLSDAAGALVEPLANAVHMLGLGGHAVYRDVVVLGSGTLGLLAAATARLAGARHIIVTDTESARLDVAQRLGANLTLLAGDENATACVLETTDGGADLVIEAVGITATRRQAIEVAAPGGIVVLLGNAEWESTLPLTDVVNREITVQGSYSSTDEEFRRGIALLADGAIETDSWVELTTLDRGPAYFQRLVSDPGGLVKVMFRL